MKASLPGGSPKQIPECEIRGSKISILLYVLPEITDSKSAVWNDEPIMGRSFPVKTYARSDNRSISMNLHFYITKPEDVNRNLDYLRQIESLTYPQPGNGSYPFLPPKIVTIKCGKLLGNNGLCVILKNYSVNYPTNVPWAENDGAYLPYKFSVSTTWDAIHSNKELPNSEKILTGGSGSTDSGGSGGRFSNGANSDQFL